MTSASARLEVRVRPEIKSRVEHAAQVVAEHETYTRVPATFYEDFIAALETPAEPSPALARAAQRVNDVGSST